jgi:uncharacterized membrane protein YgcG
LENIETIVTNCIEEIKSNKSTLAECLNRYSSRRGELELLLNIALNINQPPVFKLDNNYKIVARNKLLQQIATTKQKTPKSFVDLFSFGLPLQFAWAKIVVSAFVLMILVSMLTGATVYAAQDSVPGDLLYAIKKGTEDARLLLASKGVDKVELNLEFAQTRLVEMSKLDSRNAGKMEFVIAGYRDNLNAAQQEIQGIQTYATLSDILDRSLRSVQNQITFCDRIIDTNSAYSEPVKKASNLNISEQAQLQKILAQQNISQATQHNLNVMNNRLLRAVAKANANQYQTMQEALLQYQQFNQIGQQILQMSKEQNKFSIEIGQVYSEALKGYLTILDSVSKHVPEEYYKSIEACRQMTEQFQIQSVYSNQNQGKSDTSPRETTSGKDNGTNTGQDAQNAPQNQERGTNKRDSGGTSSGGTGSGGTGSGGTGSGGTGSGGTGSGGTGSGGTGSGGNNSGSGR